MPCLPLTHPRLGHPLHGGHERRGPGGRGRAEAQGLRQLGLAHARLWLRRGRWGDVARLAHPGSPILSPPARVGLDPKSIGHVT